MPKPLSNDLRERIVGAVAAGASIRTVAARYAVSASAVSKISQLWRRTGSVAPKPMGGDRRSQKTEAYGTNILSLVEETPDITLDEIVAALHDTGASVGRSSVWRFLDRRDLSVKKNRARRRTGTTRRRTGAGVVADDASDA